MYKEILTRAHEKEFGSVDGEALLQMFSTLYRYFFQSTSKNNLSKESQMLYNTQNELVDGIRFATSFHLFLLVSRVTGA